jgi:nitrite reductase/ring-hydroxylating ferredoxin subunit
MIKGWEFGEQKTLVCANVDGKFLALQGNCPRCGFDLFRGDLIANDPGWEDLPRIACPTCATTYSLVSGKKGPPIVRKGLAGFVGGLAKTATTAESNRDAEAFQITLDEEGRVYCRAKKTRK